MKGLNHRDLGPSKVRPKPVARKQSVWLRNCPWYRKDCLLHRNQTPTHRPHKMAAKRWPLHRLGQGFQSRKIVPQTAWYQGEARFHVKSLLRLLELGSAKLQVPGDQSRSRRLFPTSQASRQLLRWRAVSLQRLHRGKLQQWSGGCCQQQGALAEQWRFHPWPDLVNHPSPIANPDDRNEQKELECRD